MSNDEHGKLFGATTINCFARIKKKNYQPGPKIENYQPGPASPPCSQHGG